MATTYNRAVLRLRRVRISDSRVLKEKAVQMPLQTSKGNMEAMKVAF